MKEHESRVSDSAAATPRSELHLQDIQIDVEGGNDRCCTRPLRRP